MGIELGGAPGGVRHKFRRRVRLAQIGFEHQRHVAGLRHGHPGSQYEKIQYYGNPP